MDGDGKEYYLEYLSGSDAALEKIVELYNKPLVLFICGYSIDIHSAEDIAAETFLELILKKNRFVGASSLKTWLFGIAKNKAIDHLRKLGRRKNTSIDEASGIADSLCAEGELLASERNCQLYLAMLSLPEEYRTVLHLFYFCRMSYEEIASTTKKTVKQVNNTAYRARIALKKELERRGFEYENG